VAVTLSQLKTSIAAYVLKGESGDLITAWTEIATDALDMAYAEIRSILVNRGYTTTQVDAWDDLDAFWKRQAVYLAMAAGAGLHNYDDRFIEKLKPDLKFLETAQISINGEQATPDDESEGMVLRGDLDTEEDTYTKDMEL